DRDRRPLCREGSRRWLSDHRSRKSGSSRAAVVGMPHLPDQRCRRDPACDAREPLMDLLGPLFRREAGRLLAIMTRAFRVHNIALAEDVVQEALCRALEVWKLRGVPENPSAWLITTAKNCALDTLRRAETARNFAPELARLLEQRRTLPTAVEELLDRSAINDDQLRMMFSCCNPALS